MVWHSSPTGLGDLSFDPERMRPRFDQSRLPHCYGHDL